MLGLVRVRARARARARVRWALTSKPEMCKMGLLACPTGSAAASASSAEQAARIAQVKAGHKDPLDDAARPKAPAGLEAPQRSSSNPVQ